MPSAGPASYEQYQQFISFQNQGSVPGTPPQHISAVALPLPSIPMSPFTSPSGSPKQEQNQPAAGTGSSLSYDDFTQFQQFQEFQKFQQWQEQQQKRKEFQEQYDQFLQFQELQKQQWSGNAAPPRGVNTKYPDSASFPNTVAALPASGVHGDVPSTMTGSTSNIMGGASAGKF